MKELKNYNIKGKMKFNFVINMFMFIFLSWICHMNNDACTTNGSLEIKYKIDRNLNISLNRLLAKHDIQRELKQARLKEDLSNHMNCNKMKDNLEDTSSYRNLKRKDLSDLDNYKKCYKNRYSRKKGLAKLDCYYEKKVFDKIDEIYELSRKMKNDKKAFKKKIYNKFGYALIIFALIPLLGLAIPSFFNKYNPLVKKWCFKGCTSLHGKESGNSQEAHSALELVIQDIDKDTWMAIEKFNFFFFILLEIIFLCIIIYVLLKVIKYERLKVSKNKMNFNEYYVLCKNIF
ncbi:Plasmodium exported protein, unknown function [Plasmodium vivax]|uniref:Variable surface protein Vir35 n=1 Tax=Plasmodium vivax TaxID=5855 RepID=A0A564ZT35_PLAVI|nr:Plasmodium exported protein, unknown function [Plasmodium vivax]